VIAFTRCLVRFPKVIDKRNDVEFTNTITGDHPLVFHFACYDWLCACTVFELEGFKKVPSKFRNNGNNRYSLSFDRVQEGILEVAEYDDGNVGMHLQIRN
jgi:alkyl hydroperoxide reductase subunit AhpC